MERITNILDVETLIDNIDVVIFDLDDTLYSEKDYVISGYRAVSENYKEFPDMEALLRRAFEQGKKAFNEVFAAKGILDEDNLNKAIMIYRHHEPIISLYEGVEDMLVRIKSLGKKLGLITDGRPEGQRAKIKSLRLEGLFDKIIITDELGGVEFRKPNEKAFVIMQEFFGKPFGKMMYIGDNSKKDFVAPCKLGMKSCHFANKDGLYT